MTQIIKTTKHGQIKSNQNKASCFTAGAHSAGNHSDMDMLILIKTIPHGFMQETITEKDKYPFLAAQSPASKYLIQNNTPIVVCELSSHQNDKLLLMEGKSKTVTAQGGNNGGNTGRLYSNDGIEWRKLTVIECERLQTLPDKYTEGISNSRRYHAIGNGWTVDVIVHIFSFIKL